MSTQVVLLNADYQFLNVVDWKRALSLVVKEKAEIVKYSEKVVSTISNTIKVPKILRMTYMIKRIYNTKVPFNKKFVFLRDNNTCGYCGAKVKGFALTIDHIMPKSRGGKNDYLNITTSCRPCNGKKGDRTPKEANMRQSNRLFVPTVADVIRIKLQSLGLSKEEIYGVEV